MQPAEIVAGMWPGRVAAVEPLGGGITNHNFKVIVEGKAYVLRIGGKDTDLLGIDRRAEHAASVAAAACGVGPEVIGFVEPEGYLVTRFVEGSPVSIADVPVRKVAEALRRFHESPPIPSRFDSFRVVEVYRETAAARGATTPASYERAKRIADEIEAARGSQPRRPCHNDLLNANLIDEGGRIRIVDWEYAGMGDVFFDLANFSVNHELSQERNEELLRARFGELKEEDIRSLILMRFMSDFREAMWGVVQQTVSELDFDFEGYAREHFDRLERTAAEPDFREALDA